MRFSVIIPLYNKAAYIVRAVESVLDQNWQDYELLVVDDGSTDGGLQLVLDLFHDVRIHCIVQPNSGEGAARNRGLKEMRGDAAAFLDADDEWLPTHLRDLAMTAAAYPEAGVLATGFRAVYGDGLIADHSIDRRAPSLIVDYYSLAALGRAVHVSAVAVGRPVLMRSIRFAEDVPIGADEEFYARAALYAPLAYHPRVSAMYHHDIAGSVMAKAGWSPELPFTAKSLQRMLGEDIIPANRRKSASRYVRWILEQHALSGLTHGKKRDAVFLLRRAKAGFMASLLQFLPAMPVRLAVGYRRSRWYLPIDRLLARLFALACPSGPARPTIHCMRARPEVRF